MVGIEGYKGTENTQSVKKTDFSDTLNKEVKKRIDFKSIKNKEKLSRDIENALEKSSIRSLDERGKVADFLLDKFKSRNTIKDKITLIIEYEAETLENVKELLEVDEEKKEVDEEKKEVDEEEKEVDEEKKEGFFVLKEKNWFKGEQTEQILKHTEQIQEHEDKSKEFSEYKEKIDRVNNSLSSLDKNNPIYGDLIEKIKNFRAREDLQNLDIKELLKEFKEIIGEFKQNPRKLQAVVKDLGGVGTVEYEEFKSSVLGVDSSFVPYFKDIEAIDVGKSLPTTEVENNIEREAGGIMDLKLGESPPQYDMSMIGSDYKFENMIDVSKMAKITEDNKEELNEIKNNGFNVLKDFKNNFTKKDYDISKLDNLYTHFDIDSNLQINPNDLEDFRNAENLEQKLKIFSERIKPKIDAITKIVSERQREILEQYKDQIKQIIKIQQEKQEKQKQILEFLHKTGFDLIPQEITDRLIKEIQTNQLTIEGLSIDPKRLDIKNGIFGNSGLEANSEQIFKKNILAFMNKLIYGEINPKNSLLKIENYSGLSSTDISYKLNTIFQQKGIMSMTGAWNTYKMRSNLDSKKYPPKN